MEGTLVFDGNCGFCTRSRNLLIRLDRHHRVTTIPLQRPDARLISGLDAEVLAVSVWWFGVDGSRCCGAAAVNTALSSALGTRLPLLVYRLPGMRQAQEAIYRWVAAHRHQLPGTTPWCSSHPEQCETDTG